MSDLISRQAAIDAILAIKDYGNSDRANALGLAECAVTTLPSEQPEVIRCEDCKWRRNRNGTMAWIPCRALVTPDDFYCKYAERKEQ